MLVQHRIAIWDGFTEGWPFKPSMGHVFLHFLHMLSPQKEIPGDAHFHKQWHYLGSHTSHQDAISSHKREDFIHLAFWLPSDILRMSGFHQYNVRI